MTLSCDASIDSLPLCVLRSRCHLTEYGPFRADPPRALAPLRPPSHGCWGISRSIYSLPSGHPGAASYPH
jgi:hypothetical protein